MHYVHFILIISSEIKSFRTNLLILILLDKTDLKNIENFISKISRHLSPSHYILLEAKQQLAGVLRDYLNKTWNVPKKSIMRKLEICKEFLPLLDVLEPGISRLRGT